MSQILEMHADLVGYDRVVSSESCQGRVGAYIGLFGGDLVQDSKQKLHIMYGLSSQWRTLVSVFESYRIRLKIVLAN